MVAVAVAVVAAVTAVGDVGDVGGGEGWGGENAGRVSSGGYLEKKRPEAR